MERPDRPVALLRQRSASLLTVMPAAQTGDEGSIHDARVASRRLREALPVLGAGNKPGAITRADRGVRRITRALGPVRELDVALSMLTEMEANGAAPGAIARVRQALTEERQKRRRQMLDALTPARLTTLRKRLGDVTQEPASAAAADAREEAALRAGKRARRLRVAIGKAGGLYVPERLHRVRVAAKKLRYALEIQRALARGRARAQLNRLKAQQDLLGRMHDLEILSQRTRAVRDALRPRDRDGVTELDGLVRMLEDECREKHGAYLRARPPLLELCDAVIDASAQFRSSAA
jgi:CHAD domain-containing protein